MTSPQSSSTHISALHGWRSVAFHSTVFLLSCAIVIARRPDAVLHAQFYAEDGSIWFADAYNYGWWRVLFSPYEGYLHVVPRAAGAIAVLFPIACAPLIENLIAIAIQAIPVNVLVSSRSKPWGSFRFRALLASVYLFLPNTREMFATVTESQWFLALIALLLLVALPPRSRAARAFDIVTFALCGLTGPFCIALFPIALLLLSNNRQDFWRRSMATVLFLGCIAQTLSLLLHPSGRHHPILGATPEWFVRILSGQIYLGTLLGGNGLSLQLSVSMLASIAVVGTMILVLCALFTHAAMRSLLFLSCLLLIAALVSPITFPTPDTTAWKMLAGSPGARYWFFPSLAFAWSIVYAACSSARVYRVATICLLVIMSVGFVRDFRYPAFSDLTYPQYVKRMATVQPGTIVTIPVNPTGWSMWLIKR